jgi:transcription initiation factor TFIIIB Brf1 subunit/transcription initiation factor TFIIB
MDDIECPDCGSQDVEEIDENEMVCSDCGSEFGVD